MTTDQKKTVLVADDERRWCVHAQHLLSGDYNVETVNDCDAILERVEGGGIDLVVIDHLMPGTDPLGTGFDVSSYLREKYPDLPLIMYTGAWEPDKVTSEVKFDRKDLESKTGAIVVCKVPEDPVLDSLPARVKELLAPRPVPGTHRFCSECGQPVQPTAKFCSECGREIVDPTGSC